jgi:hypothetical protein
MIEPYNIIHALTMCVPHGLHSGILSIKTVTCVLRLKVCFLSLFFLIDGIITVTAARPNRRRNGGVSFLVGFWNA